MSKLRRFILAGISTFFILNAFFIAPASAIIDWRFFSRNSIDLYDDECVDVSGAAAVILAGDDNEQKILNFFMRKGLNLAQAAGLVGNMMVESGLKSNIREGGQLVDDNYTPENGVGFGLVQWTFTARQQPLIDFTTAQGVPVTDLGGQLGFVWEELNGQWLGTLNKLRATDDPLEAAVIVHDEYEISAQSPAQVRSTRGENAKTIYAKYSDAPALAGVGAEDDLQNPGGDPDTSAQNVSQTSTIEKQKGCTEPSFAGGNFNETLKHYAWNEYKGLDTEATPEYTEATTRARSEGRYIGGITHPGIDCGGFVTLLINDSGYDKGYNYEGKGGPTSTQAEWASKNWQTLGESSGIDESTLQPGDVAINASHTFIYVGDVDGFEAKIASASLDERAPMADTAQQATQPGFTWYRKK